jgi:hypothetical protein
MTIRRLHCEGVRVYATIAPTLPCNPVRLAGLVEDIIEGVIVSGFCDDGANGNNILPNALNLIRANGWDFCLASNYAQKVADLMREVLGPKVYLGREGFSRLTHI